MWSVILWYSLNLNASEELSRKNWNNTIPYPLHPLLRKYTCLVQSLYPIPYIPLVSCLDGFFPSIRKHSYNVGWIPGSDPFWWLSCITVFTKFTCNHSLYFKCPDQPEPGDRYEVLCCSFALDFAEFLQFNNCKPPNTNLGPSHYVQPNANWSQCPNTPLHPNANGFPYSTPGSSKRKPFGEGKRISESITEEAAFEMGPDGWAEMEAKDIPIRGNYAEGVIALVQRHKARTLVTDGRGFKL